MIRDDCRSRKTRRTNARELQTYAGQRDSSLKLSSIKLFIVNLNTVALEISKIIKQRKIDLKLNDELTVKKTTIFLVQRSFSVRILRKNLVEKNLTRIKQMFHENKLSLVTYRLWLIFEMHLVRDARACIFLSHDLTSVTHATWGTHEASHWDGFWVL